MVQAIFYAMVMDDAAEQGLCCRLTMDCMMWAIRKLNWNPIESWLRDIDLSLRRAQASRPANPPGNLAPSGDPKGRRITLSPFFQGITRAAKYVRENLYLSVRESSKLRANLLPWNFAGLCPKFDHPTAMQFAHAAHIPEMVQAIFHAMVINDVVKLRLSSRDAIGCMTLDRRELKWDIIEAWLLPIDERLRDA